MRRIKRAPASQISNKFLLHAVDFLFQRKAPKGQWFIISAVVASSVFFALSLLMRDYFIVDSSYFASLNNEHYFYDVTQQFDKVVAGTRAGPDCTNLTSRLDELKEVAEHELASHGLFGHFEYRILNSPCSSAGNNVTLDFLVGSQNEILHNFSTYTSPAQIIGAV